MAEVGRVHHQGAAVQRDQGVRLRRDAEQGRLGPGRAVPAPDGGAALTVRTVAYRSAVRKRAPPSARANTCPPLRKSARSRIRRGWSEPGAPVSPVTVTRQVISLPPCGARGSRAGSIRYETSSIRNLSAAGTPKWHRGR
ncbi:hypothetical protein CF54_30190 [Streptomyces sp. Tu 6176]|nr:hypothetical protein CF54_30190 [Streptomyces sp. Tu 6176]